MKTIELSEKDVNIILALIDFVKDQPCGLEAIMGYPGIDDNTVWDDVNELESKI
jgi:hypothetical protein